MLRHQCHRSHGGWVPASTSPNGGHVLVVEGLRDSGEGLTSRPLLHYTLPKGHGGSRRTTKAYSLLPLRSHSLRSALNGQVPLKFCCCCKDSDLKLSRRTGGVQLPVCAGNVPTTRSRALHELQQVTDTPANAVLTANQQHPRVTRIKSRDSGCQARALRGVNGAARACIHVVNEDARYGPPLSLRIGTALCFLRVEARSVANLVRGADPEVHHNQVLGLGGAAGATGASHAATIHEWVRWCTQALLRQAAYDRGPRLTCGPLQLLLPEQPDKGWRGHMTGLGGLTTRTVVVPSGRTSFEATCHRFGERGACYEAEYPERVSWTQPGCWWSGASLTAAI